MLHQFADGIALAAKSTSGSIFKQSEMAWSMVVGFHKAHTSSSMPQMASIKKWVELEVVDLIRRDLPKDESLAWQSSALVDFGCMGTNIGKCIIIQSCKNHRGL